MTTVFSGVVFYASASAKRNRMMKEGRTVTVRDYHHAIKIGADFVQIDLDSTGINYIHMTISKETEI